MTNRITAGQRLYSERILTRFGNHSHYHSQDKEGERSLSPSYVEDLRRNTEPILSDSTINLLASLAGGVHHDLAPPHGRPGPRQRGTVGWFPSHKRSFTTPKRTNPLGRRLLVALAPTTPLVPCASDEEIPLPCEVGEESFGLGAMDEESAKVLLEHFPRFVLLAEIACTVSVGDAVRRSVVKSRDLSKLCGLVRLRRTKCEHPDSARRARIVGFLVLAPCVLVTRRRRPRIGASRESRSLTPHFDLCWPAKHWSALTKHAVQQHCGAMQRRALQKTVHGLHDAVIRRILSVMRSARIRE